jgi:hypothetical protein
MIKYQLSSHSLSDSTAKDICTKILETDSRIRSASICQDDGTILCSEHRSGKKSLTSQTEGQAALIQATARYFNRKLHDKKFGKTMFSLTMHEKVARIAIPLQDKYVILISAEKYADHTDLVMNDIFATLNFPPSYH